MTLNQDITDDEIIDFAFTVQGKKETTAKTKFATKTFQKTTNELTISSQLKQQ